MRGRVVLKYNEGIPAMNKETEVEIIKKFIVKNKQEENYLEITKCQKKTKKRCSGILIIRIFSKKRFYIRQPTRMRRHLEKVLYEMSGTRECYVIG